MDAIHHLKSIFHSVPGKILVCFSISLVILPFCYCKLLPPVDHLYGCAGFERIHRRESFTWNLCCYCTPSLAFLQTQLCYTDQKKKCLPLHQQPNPSSVTNHQSKCLILEEPNPMESE